ncbi:MAG: acyl-CoA dehydrogenase family protein [Isosphaeraceae bacterium]
MDFAFDDTQRRWHDEAVTFAREHLAGDVLDRDHRGEFDRNGWAACGRFGIHGLPVPEPYGGRGQDLIATMAAMEGLGYAAQDGGLLMAINACLWTVTLPILKYGTEGQKNRWLTRLAAGQLVGANAASEPGAGSDVFGMTTRAQAAEGDAGGWVLNGRKTWCTAAPVADLFVVFASTSPERKALGISAFLIPAGTPGLHVVREIPKMGTRTAPMGEIVLEDCRLPTDALLGRLHRGADIFQAALEWERGGILSPTLGMMRRQLERCIAHARKREQFGQPIGKYQAVSHRIVEMSMRLETSRLLVHKYAWKKARGEDATAEASMAKIHVSESATQNSLAAIQVFGALGFTVENGAERELRDSIGAGIYSGTNDIQRNILARRLGLG